MGLLNVNLMRLVPRWLRRRFARTIRHLVAYGVAPDISSMRADIDLLGGQFSRLRDELHQLSEEIRETGTAAETSESIAAALRSLRREQIELGRRLASLRQQPDRSITH